MARSTKPAQMVTVAIGELTVDVIARRSIRIRGQRQTGQTRTGQYRVRTSEPDVRPQVVAWLDGLSSAQHNELASLFGLRPDGSGIASDWIEEHGGERDWEGHLNSWPVCDPVYTDVDITYSVGDQAEWGSFNRSYIGRIISITAKTVVIEDDNERTRSGQPARHRLKLAQFVYRNWDGLEGKLRNNREWTD